MKKIKRLHGQRWFIWAIVIAVVSLLGLSTYINHVSLKDSVEIPVQVPNNNKIVISPSTVKLPVTESGAITLIRGLPEVKVFMTRVSANHTTGHVSVDGTVNMENVNSQYWVVHVYESLKNHDNTFNWYHVYVKTGVIEKQY